MKKGMVSVVVPNYNYAHFIGETIESVFAQTYTNWELIIVDDNSNDNSRELVESYIKKYPQYRIRQFHNKTGPSGTPTPINIGVRNMEGEYFAWLSSDDAYMPTKLEEQVRLLEKRPDIAMVHTSISFMDDDGTEYKERIIEDLDQDEFFIRMLEKNLVNGNTVVIRKSILDKVGLYMQSHPVFPCVYTVSEYLKHLEIVMHGGIGVITKPVHKTRMHKGNKTYADTLLGKVSTRIVKKFLLKQYTLPGIIKRLKIPTGRREQFLLRLWNNLQRDAITSSFPIEAFRRKEEGIPAQADELEYIKLGIKMGTQLVLNRKIREAQKQLQIINEKVGDLYYHCVKELKNRELLEILNEGKRLFRTGKSRDMDNAREIFQLVVDDQLVPKSLKMSGLFYLASVLKEKGLTDKQKEALESLLQLAPAHTAANAMLEEIKRK
ncbi:MAG: glycosyltransferase family 2 protein [bacterium]|nr:glycosyltransferase family 2 protein [bacterium]